MKVINNILPIVIAGAIAVSVLGSYGCSSIRWMSRHEHIRADCLEKYRNDQVRSYVQCVEAGYAAEREGK